MVNSTGACNQQMHLVFHRWIGQAFPISAILTMRMAVILHQHATMAPYTSIMGSLLAALAARIEETVNSKASYDLAMHLISRWKPNQAWSGCPAQTMRMAASLHQQANLTLGMPAHGGLSCLAPRQKHDHNHNQKTAPVR